ncbi:MAG: hypothetical protein GYA61_08410 [Spirochaetales bacterium]|nr:hypothetical protein [Spirochaetales bacterium]
MKDIKIHEILQAFGEVTFNRGMDYFENGYVEMGVKKGNKLVGTVHGAAPAPYKVRVEITDEIYSKCTCPVGRMCKHGVALTLQWVNKKSTFSDADHIIASLKEKDKKELLNIVNLMVEEDPFLASKLMSSRELSESKVNLEAISRRINYSTHGFIDYYEVSGVVNELEDVKKIADNLKAGEYFKEASEIYLLMIEKGADIYGNTDDSSGLLGDVVMECVEDFCNCMEGARAEEKLDLIPRLIKIVENENYGLDTDDMLFAVASQDNMHLIEEELLTRIPQSGDRRSEYQREKLVNLLFYLYQGLNLHADALKVIVTLGFKNKNDYLRIANALMDEDRKKEAFGYVKEGVRLKEKGDYALDELYFKFLKQLPLEKWVDVKEDEVMEIALRLLDSRFDTKVFPLIKIVFMKLGRYNELIQAIKSECRVEVAIPLLLHDDHVEDAIERALTSSSLPSSLLIKVAMAARKKGKTADAVNLTLEALKDRWPIKISENFIELTKLLVETSDNKKLEEAIDQVRNVSAAKVLANALLTRDQEYTMRLLERLLKDLDLDEIKWYMKKLDAKYAIELSKSWISYTVNRSHVHYDDAIDIMGMLKEIMSKAKYRMYIQDFVTANKGKKKLLNKMEGIDLI